MTRSFVSKVATVAAFAAVVVAPGAAQAQNTVLNFTGSARINDPDPRVGQGNTLVINFVPIGQSTGAIRVVDDVDLTGVSAGDAGVIQDLVANSGGFTTSPANFVTVGGYTFSLVSTTTGQSSDPGSPINVFGPIYVTQNGANVVATFNVAGVATGPGFAGERNYNGIFTTQFTNTTIAALTNRIDRGNNVRASFSATFVLASVPEPSTYALMASGVAMLGLFARRRRVEA